MDCFGYHRSELLNVYESMMDSIADSRKRNLEGQMGLFGMLEQEDKATAIPIPPKAELSRAELMAMEKETTGIYLSGHPMDDYRKFLKNTHVLPISTLMGEDCPVRDEQIVSVAGIIQAVKMKSTRNNSMMAYVTVEDDTASMEMLAFSNVLSQYGGYLRENEAVVITGRLSLRDDKDPQIVINRARPISDFAQHSEEVQTESQPQSRRAPQILTGKLYLKLPTEASAEYHKVKAILNMFPGSSDAVHYFADTKLRRGTRCALAENMLLELKNLLGNENVVVK
jgi:DNA polymerase-3 subunit alpha